MAIIIKSKANWFEAPIDLQPVGMDADGQLKQIYDLSYTPADGWGFPPTQQEGQSHQRIVTLVEANKESDPSQTNAGRNGS